MVHPLAAGHDNMVCCERRHQGKSTAGPIFPVRHPGVIGSAGHQPWAGADSGTAAAGAGTALSERARAAALAETMQLRLAGSKLADAVSGAERQGLLRAVTLLTTQAKALTGPDQGPSPSATGAAAGTPAVTASGTSAPSSGQAAPLDSPAALITALSASGGQRLSDAEGSDGGMARLLAAVGTAQLLQASSLATAVGAAAPDMPALQDRQRATRARQHRQARARRPRPVRSR